MQFASFGAAMARLPRSVGVSMGAALVAVAGAFAAPAQAAELVPFTTVRNTDVASFGLGGLRGTGSGTLSVSGVTGPVSRAYLYWAGSTNSTDPLVNASVSFGGSSITGVNIGTSHDNFWGVANSQAYRADVTGIVTGDGAYALANFEPRSVLMNGVSLILFHDDGNAANNRDILLFDGNDANYGEIFDALGWNAVLSGVNYAGGPASLTLHVSDGQPQVDGTLVLNGAELGSGPLYSGDSVPTANPNVDTLWDIETFDLASHLTSGLNDLTLAQSTDGAGDAVALIVAQISLAPTVGSGPATPVPEPSTWAVMIVGFGLVGAAARRRRRAAWHQNR